MTAWTENRLYAFMWLDPLNAEADPHAQKSAVLTINIGHPVALPAAPHFYCCLALKGSLLSRLDTPRRVVAAFGRNFCFLLSQIQMHEL